MEFKQQVNAINASEMPVWEQINFIKTDEKKYKVEIINLLEEVNTIHDEKMLYTLLEIASKDGIDTSYIPLLCNIILDNWHKAQEDIISIFEDIRSPDTIDCIYATAMNEPSDEDSYAPMPITVKAIWALAAINTPTAIELIRRFSKSHNRNIAEAANAYLAKLSS